MKGIGYCGINCDECGVGSGKLAEAAENLESLYVKDNVEKWYDKGPKGPEFDFTELKKAITWFKERKPCVGCKQGGGALDCKIRKCAEIKGVEVCAKCPELNGCEHMAFMRKIHES